MNLYDKYTQDEFKEVESKALKVLSLFKDEKPEMVIDILEVLHTMLHGSQLPGVGKNIIDSILEMLDGQPVWECFQILEYIKHQIKIEGVYKENKNKR